MPTTSTAWDSDGMIQADSSPESPRTSESPPRTPESPPRTPSPRMFESPPRTSSSPRAAPRPFIPSPPRPVVSSDDSSFEVNSMGSSDLPTSSQVERVSPRSSLSSSDRSDTSQSDDSIALEDRHMDYDVPCAAQDDDIAPLLSSLAELQLHSKPTTPSRGRLTPGGYTAPVSEDMVPAEDAESNAALSRHFFKTIKGMLRTQTIIDKRTVELESELARLRAQFVESVKTSRSLLVKTRETIVQERRDIARAQEGACDTVKALEQQLAKAQVAIATLQAQHLANKEAMDSMSNDIAAVLSIQDEMGRQLERLDECEQKIRHDVHSTRERLAELASDEAFPPLANIYPTRSSLAEELSAVATPLGVAHRGQDANASPQTAGVPERSADVSAAHPSGAGRGASLSQADEDQHQRATMLSRVAAFLAARISVGEDVLSNSYRELKLRVPRPMDMKATTARTINNIVMYADWNTISRTVAAFAAVICVVLVWWLQLRTPPS
ncbi:hypothetical protein C8Q76DRAFT_804429 [Earliella scabrosa]|nr:hypothetical protein C8Q76DRAFT_804429 [Earliella scabrosa]